MTKPASNTVQESLDSLVAAVNRVGDIMEEDSEQQHFMEMLFGTLMETYKAFHETLEEIVNEPDQFKKVKGLRAALAAYSDAEKRAIEKIKELGESIEIEDDVNDDDVNDEAEADNE